MKADILCETEGCPKQHDIINTVTFPMEEEGAFYEAFGFGGEEEADFCPECKRLGILQEPAIEEHETKKLIEKARELYAIKSDDNIEVDDNAKTSMASESDRDGIWVEAWVWVPTEGIDFSKEEPKKYICNICEKKFSSHRELNGHKNAHKG